MSLFLWSILFHTTSIVVRFPIYELSMRLPPKVSSVACRRHNLALSLVALGHFFSFSFVCSDLIQVECFSQHSLYLDNYMTLENHTVTIIHDYVHPMVHPVLYIYAHKSVNVTV